jgi:hypothetical protein
VFLSHAGEQKRDFVSCVYTNLKAWNVRAFLDELSMQPGERSNMRAIQQALQDAAVGEVPAKQRQKSLGARTDFLWVQL